MLQCIYDLWNKFVSYLKNEEPPLKNLKDINFETDEDIWHWDLVERSDDSKEEMPEGGYITVTTSERGECVMVSRQDEEHQILEVIWQKDPEMIAAEKDLEEINSQLEAILERTYTLLKDYAPFVSTHFKTDVYADTLVKKHNAMRDIFHVNMLRYHPEMTHEQIAAEIDKVDPQPKKDIHE